MKTVLSFLALSINALGLSAQSPADSIRSDTLKAVTVSATRLPTRAEDAVFSVSVVDGAYIRRAQAQLSLQESLGAVPGVFTLNDANFAQDLRIAVRGFGARAAFGIRGIKIFLDGIPESAPDGQAQVDNLDMAVLDRLEILRGTSGGLYGNASGGVISLYSDAAMDAGTTARSRVRLSGGAYGFVQLHGKTGISRPNGGFWLSFTHQQLDGYRAHAAFRSTVASGKWTWAPDSASRLHVLINYVNSPRADDPGALTRAQADADRRAANPANIRYQAGESVQQGRVGVVYEKRWTGQLLMRLRGYSSRRDFENRLPLQNGGQVAFQRWFAGGGALFEWKHARWRFGGGFDLDHQADERQRYDNLDGRRGNQNLDQRELFTGAGVFALAEWHPAPRWTVSGGARFDRVQLRVRDHWTADGMQSGHSAFRQWSPWVGALWHWSSGLNAFINGSTNFETPTLNELSNKPDQSGGFNSGLELQRSLSGEAGLRGRWPWGLSAELAVFRSATRQELTPYELPDVPGRSFYRNAGATRRQGLELALRWLPAPGLYFSLVYTLAGYQYVRYATPAGDFSGRELPGLPRHLGMLEAGYAPGAGFFGRIKAQYTGRFFADDANAQPVNPCVMLHARVGYRRQFSAFAAECFIGSDNLNAARCFNNIRLNAGRGRHFEPGAGPVILGGMEVQW